jgi:hypothetical protein
MNVVLDDAEEVSVKTKEHKAIGRIMLKGDNITCVPCLASLAVSYIRVPLPDASLGRVGPTVSISSRASVKRIQ